MVLADTSVWIDHWRRGNLRLSELLRQGQIVVHPFVRGEIALGPMTERAAVLQRLSELPQAPVAQHDEVMALIERAPLWRRGVGWVDAHLLASALLGRLHLWTLDRPLARVASDLGLKSPLSRRERGLGGED